MKIQNEYLEASFLKKGAELCSLKSKTSGIEYIWQADPTHWGRHAPVLFPFVGKLKNDSFEFNDKHYSMSQHGFARDADFEVEKSDEASISFLLKSSPQTLDYYPFHFELRLQYFLSGKKLMTNYQVINSDPQNPMFFSIGGHPAFNTPVNEEGSRSDFQLIFNQPENAEAYLLSEGLFSGETAPALTNGRLPISTSSFDKDALVFKNLKSVKVDMQKADAPYLSFQFDGFPYLGIWSKNQVSPFVCIEPWYGLADHQNHNGKVQEKEGIHRLPAFGTFNCTYQIITY